MVLQATRHSPCLFERDPQWFSHRLSTVDRSGTSKVLQFGTQALELSGSNVSSTTLERMRRARKALCVASHHGVGYLRELRGRILEEGLGHIGKQVRFAGR